MTSTLSLLFGVFLVVVVAIRYFGFKRERCPECFTPRDKDYPMCHQCSWIFEEADSADNGEYDELEEVENWR